MDKQSTDQDKIFVSHMSDNRLICRTYREFLKFNSEKT